MRGQAASIGLIVAAGLAVFVASISTYGSLESARDRFYTTSHFPDLFVSLVRAPLTAVPRLEAIDGVSAVETRIVGDVIVDDPASPQPVSAHVVSLPATLNSALSRVVLQRGVMPPSGSTDSVLVNEAFANAGGTAMSAPLRVLLNGRLRTLSVSGSALSPEYIYAVKAGLPIPQDRFFAIMWVDRKLAEAAFDMEGAFNEVVVTVAPGANIQAVAAELDRALARYGSTGATGRRDQASNRFVEDELAQQRVMSTTVPFIFFAVGAFLINVTMVRLVATQREQIAALKALGFPTRSLVAHYLGLVTVIVLGGSLVGTLAGYGFGLAMIASYRDFFRLPDLVFQLAPWSVMLGAGISLVVAAIGALVAVKRVAALPPAIAMRPASPVGARHLWGDRTAFGRLLGPRQLMVVRAMAGRPFRTVFTVIGIAFAVPIVVLGLFWQDAIQRMIEVQFGLVDRGNVQLGFTHPVSRDVLSALARLPGVMAAEGSRAIPVRISKGSVSATTVIVGLPSDRQLQRPRDMLLAPIEIGPEGVTIDQRLADRIGVAKGSVLTVEVLDGTRTVRTLLVSGIANEMVGLANYMDIGALNRLVGEGDVISGASVFVDPGQLAVFLQRARQLPIIASVSVKAYAMEAFLTAVVGLVVVAALILTTFAVIIAAGVVYNSARIGFQERAWELATLRVLGFRRGETAALLMEEFLLDVAVAIPLGLALARTVVNWMASRFSSESFQIPAVIDVRTYWISAGVIALVAAGSAFIIRRRVDRLDLVSVLKTRE